MITDQKYSKHEATCYKLYELYSDYAMKNPFYQQGILNLKYRNATPSRVIPTSGVELYPKTDLLK